MRFRRREFRRKVFGFLCTLEVALWIRDLSRRMALPVYTLAEHALGLGAAQIEADLQDEKLKEDLRDYLIRQHFLAPLLAIKNEYDLYALARMRWQQMKRLELERVTSELVQVIEHEGIPPGLLVDIAGRLIERARRTRREY